MGTNISRQGQKKSEPSHIPRQLWDISAWTAEVGRLYLRRCFQQQSADHYGGRRAEHLVLP